MLLCFLFLRLRTAHCTVCIIPFFIFTHKCKFAAFFRNGKLMKNLRSIRLDGCKCFRYNIKCDNTKMLILGGL
ncbi:MAG TPA: hypothetical protein DCY17_00985 [Clostridiales bacterium]|nr:hypothetical protein [Clostridiales bacterium]